MMHENNEEYCKILIKVKDELLPLELPEKLQLVEASAEEVIAVMTKLWNEVFERKMAPFERVQTRPESNRLLINRFYDMSSYCFLVHDRKGNAVGWLWLEAQDCHTLYMRSTGIQNSLRRKGVYTKISKFVEEFAFRMGFERITSQHKEGNLPILQAKLKLGFLICGYEFHERWGRLVKMVRYLYEDLEDQFLARSNK